MLVKTAPGQEDLLDIPSDAYEPLRVQAEKFTPGELARVLSLLLAAQNDMRWTTSPRLSLELALVRATIPETDPNPAGVVARLERLERLANVEVASSPAEPPSVELPGREGGLAERGHPEDRSRDAARTAIVAQTATPPDQSAPTTTPTAPSAGSVDVSMLRRGWPSLMEHLVSTRQMILKAALESATVATFDGETLQLAFPPDRTFTVTKVEAKADDLREALGELFGIRPAIVCVVREARDLGGGPAVIEIVDEEEPPTEEEALRRVQEMFGAQVAAEAGSEPAE
jgi:DNA polymerase-3 subunit gamma/tau